MKRLIYAVTNVTDDKFYFEGDAYEISEKLGCEIGTVRNDEIKGTLFMRQFKFTRLGYRDIPNYLVHKIERSKDKPQPDLDYLIEHLRLYGNTVFKTKIDKFIEPLRARGYEVTSETHHHNLIGNYYIISLTNK